MAVLVTFFFQGELFLLYAECQIAFKAKQLIFRRALLSVSYYHPLFNHC